MLILISEHYKLRKMLVVNIKYGTLEFMGGSLMSHKVYFRTL
jgi:hypothetical protein